METLNGLIAKKDQYLFTRWMEEIPNQDAGTILWVLVERNNGFLLQEN